MYEDPTKKVVGKYFLTKIQLKRLLVREGILKKCIVTNIKKI